MVASDLFLQPKLTMIFYLSQTVSLLPIFAVDRVGASSTGAAIFGPMKCVKYASGASAGVLEYGCLRLFLQPKLTMILHLPQTVSLLPIFAIDYCVPGRCQLAVRLSNLRDV